MPCQMAPISPDAYGCLFHAGSACKQLGKQQVRCTLLKHCISCFCLGQSSTDGGLSLSHQHTIMAEWEERAEALEQRDAARLHTLEAALMREQREVRARGGHVQGGSEISLSAFTRKLNKSEACRVSEHKGPPHIC